MAKAGRPLKFGSVKELQQKVDEYFRLCDERTETVLYKGRPFEVSNPRPYTITGLALHLDTTRDTLLDYENEKHEGQDPLLQKAFSDTIKNAKLKIHTFAEESLWQPKIATGVIFNLKNNWGWQDRYEHEGKNENTNKYQIEFITNDTEDTGDERPQEDTRSGENPQDNTA